MKDPQIAASVTSPPLTWTSPHGRRLPAIGGRTLIMGILNVTPDSFSDGGQLPDTKAIIERATAMVAAGADVLDIGGESTRPGATPVSADDELARVLPAIAAVRATQPEIPISIDTLKPAVAERAIAAGADIINDVWGFTHGLDATSRKRTLEALRRRDASAPSSPMAGLVARLKCPAILMHNRPDRNYGDFWTDVRADFELSVGLALAAGVERQQLWLDPGFGFAKDAAQNLEVLKHLERILALGYPVLVGTSRKSTIGEILEVTVDDRLEGTGATVVWSIQKGCQMIRVHDVGPMARFARMADAIKQGLGYASP